MGVSGSHTRPHTRTHTPARTVSVFEEELEAHLVTVHDPNLRHTLAFGFGLHHFSHPPTYL